MSSLSSCSKSSPVTENDKTKIQNSGKGNDNLSSLSLDHIDIDDTEYDIPPIANPPTLESILNAPDYDDDDDFHNLSDQFLNDLLDSSSISSQDSSAPLRTRVPLNLLHQKQQTETKSLHGNIFRHVLLKSISSQILSASNKVDAGQPTSLTVSSLIAVGMSRGVVLIFDNKQVLKWCLGSSAVGAQYGAVSALSFNIDCTRLLAGFARGQITMWNLTNGKLLRTVTDAHPPGMAILHVRFTDDRTMAVSSDSGGSVFQLDFKRTLGVRTCESHCLFSGSKGEACVIEPLVSNQNIIDHPMKDVILVAIGTLSKMLLVVLKPQLRLHYVHSFLGDPSTLPLLAWQYVIIQMNKDRVVDPVLAFGRGNQIHFAQVMGRGPDKIKIMMLQEMTLSYKLLAIAWINSRSMVLVESSERAHLVDVRTEEELQVLDLTYVQLAYSTSFYKSLATGGNVSEAMAYAGGKACYNSVATYNHQLLLLGTKGVHVITLRSWSERINSLLKQHQYRQALQLGLMFYEGNGKGLVGLSWNEEKRKKVVNEAMIRAMTQYIDVFMLSYNCLPSNGISSNLQEDEEVVCQLEVIQTCITFCLLTDNIDFLFNFLYDKFSQNCVTKGLFLESLEAYILQDKLRSVSPVVMRDLVEHYERHVLLTNLESCLLHVDIACLDLHQTISICWQHRLWDALLDIYNRGMGDYTTPLRQLIHKLSESQRSHHADVESDKQSDQLGYKILLYISCCLTGKVFPYGELPEDKASQVREKVLLSITSFSSVSSSSIPSSPSQSPPPSSSYPYLRTLIRFDTREFFNVFSIAFDEAAFSGKSKQRLVDILLLLMLENAAFNPAQIGTLFLFLARQMSKANNQLEVKASLFEQVLESLCASEKHSRHEERQQIFIELLKAGVLERFNGGDRDDMRLVSMANNAEFYRVVEMLHVKHRKFHLVLPCYCKDAGRQDAVFKYLQQVLTDTSVSDEEKVLVRREVLASVEHLVQIDALQVARLVVAGVIEGGVVKAIEKLNSQPELLLKFLKGLFAYTSNSPEGSFFPRRSSFTGEVVAFKLEAIFFEKYVDLMCRFSLPHAQILEFLKQHLGAYIPESLLAIVSRYKIREVMCYLYEVSGDVERAFDVHMELLEEVMGGREVESEVQEGVLRVLTFLQHHKASFSIEKTNELWFRLLDVILNKEVEVNKKMRSSLSSPLLQDQMNNEDPSKRPTLQKLECEREEGMGIDFLKAMTSTIMTSAMPYLSPGSLLERIITSPAYAKGEFGELRGLLMSMMETCNYERVLMVASKDMACNDLHDLMLQLVRVARKGSLFRPNQHCSICFEVLFRVSSTTNTTSKNSKSDFLILFTCHHYYHLSCLRRLSSNDGGVDCSLESLRNRCYLCSNKKASKFDKIKSECIDQVEIDKILSEQSKLTSSPLQSTDVASFSLSPSQFISFKKAREAQKTPSSMAILSELKMSSSSPFKSSLTHSTLNSKTNKTFRSLPSASFNQKLIPATFLSQRS